MIKYVYITFCVLLSFAVKSQEITSVNQLDKVGKKIGKWVGYHENTQIKRYLDLIELKFKAF